MFRPALRAARPALRGPAQAQRQASGHAAVPAVYPLKEFEQLGMKEIKDDRILHGQHAFVWEVPKDLKPNEFIKRRRAVEEHAHGELMVRRESRGSGSFISSLARDTWPSAE